MSVMADPMVAERAIAARGAWPIEDIGDKWSWIRAKHDEEPCSVQRTADQADEARKERT